MAENNPANFANLPTEKVKEIASMGGKANRGTNGDANGDKHADELVAEGRRPDGTFLPGGKAAVEAGKKSHENDGQTENEGKDRNDNGTFTKGSEAAKEAGHVGGLHAYGKKTEEEKDEAGRDESGKFLPGSEAAKEAGHKGGVAAAANN